MKKSVIAIECLEQKTSVVTEIFVVIETVQTFIDDDEVMMVISDNDKAADKT